MWSYTLPPGTFLQVLSHCDACLLLSSSPGGQVPADYETKAGAITLHCQILGGHAVSEFVSQGPVSRNKWNQVFHERLEQVLSLCNAKLLAGTLCHKSSLKARCAATSGTKLST